MTPFKSYKRIAYPLSNLRAMQDLEEEVRGNSRKQKEDDGVKEEMLYIMKKATLFNAVNKRMRKPKEESDDKRKILW